MVAGVDAVKVFDPATDTRAWFKASVLHEFHGDQGFTAHNESDKWREASYREADGSSDTWYVVGAGFSRKIQKNTSFYVDVERTRGRVGSTLGKRTLACKRPSNTSFLMSTA